MQSFAVLPALIPDIGAVYDAYFAAFTADEDGRRLLDIIFPDGFEGDEFRAAHRAGTLKWWHESRTQYTFKCIDTTPAADGGDEKVVGMALVDVFVRPRAEEERKYHSIPWLNGDKKDRADRVLKPLWDAREKVLEGKSVICKLCVPISCHFLVTSYYTHLQLYMYQAERVWLGAFSPCASPCMALHSSPSDVGFYE